ncbi:MAG: sulfotransferase [Chloroflexi bacterium]|nr:sulfotransferase [Chloroflexota bacterium]
MPSPVFICGYPKSGTTLVLALMDSHPELLVFPEESKFLTQALDNPDRMNTDYLLTKTGPKNLGRGVLDGMPGHRDYSHIDFETYQAAAHRLATERAGDGPRSILESVILAFGEVTGHTDYRYWVEKTPHNEQHLDAAVRMWPDVTAVYILRDPRDNFGSYRLKRSREDRAFSVDEFVWRWSESLVAWLSFASSHPARALLIRYDDLVGDPPATMQRLAAFLDIAWGDVLLQPTRAGQHWGGNSMYGTQFAGISTSSLGKYREQLRPAEIERLESWLAPVMTHFGWHADTGTSSPLRLGRAFASSTGLGVKERLVAARQVLRLRALVGSLPAQSN